MLSNIVDFAHIITARARPSLMKYYQVFLSGVADVMTKKSADGVALAWLEKIGKDRV